MGKIKIYLRSISQEGKRHLALFDSNGEGGIDELTTTVERGDQVIWELDSESGIKHIEDIYSKTGKGNVFKTKPKKEDSGKAFKMKIEKEAEGEEAYGIRYVLNDGSKMDDDPRIRIFP